MLLNGDGIQKNLLEAVRYFKMGADKGNVRAMKNYAYMLMNGIGIPVNKVEAYRYLKMAKNNGNPETKSSWE